ncbi:MAG: hypothetical protein ACK4NY_00640 [Spirosomataceae bacterium]
MKSTKLFVLYFGAITGVFAQKVDLDRFYFKVNYQKLPYEFVPLENRTYGVRANVGGAIRSYTDENSIYDRVVVHGWKKIESNPTVGVEVNVDDFAFRGAETKSETVENKDKDGKVTSRTTYYWVQANYEGRGTCRIKGPMTPRTPTAKELEEKKKKEEEKTTNRFLANVNVAKPTEDNTNGFNLGLSNSYTYTSDKSTSASAVSNDFSNRKEAIYGENLRKFVDGSVSFVNSRLNSTYGFTPVNDEDFLWILNSKDHPEYQTQQEAIAAVKELFKTMKADEPISTLESNMAPLIDYLQSLKTKYGGDDKRNKKLRYSAYYNLSKIYYYLDKPEKAKEEADGLIKNGFDEKDGEKLFEVAVNLSDSMKQAKVNTRHNESLK